MKIVIRVDASLQIGTGHVMRCLTLSEALNQQGAEVSFICRAHQGNLISFIEDKGFNVFTLDTPVNGIDSLQDESYTLFHAKWLGVSQQQDADECRDIVEQIKPDWLIVDHYAIDQAWQKALKPYYQKLMVIDDLGDRQHICEFLLDQNYGSTSAKYQSLVPKQCKILAGAQYALLRPEFAKWREVSLKRRENDQKIKSILITLGGVDPDNHTEQILQQLAKAELDPCIEITVIMGATAPHFEKVKQQAASMNNKTRVKTNVNNMAELMANADLAIGAAGSTTWERCCLGLPTIQLVIAENQRQIAQALAKAHAIKLLENIEELPGQMATIGEWIPIFIENSKKITDGQGCRSRVIPVITVQDMVELDLERFGKVKLVNYTQLTKKELINVLVMRNHPGVREWMFNQKEITQDEHLKFVKNLNKSLNKQYFIVSKASEIIGVVSFIYCDDEFYSCEIGLFSNFNNKNPMTAFILEQTAIKYAFEFMGFDCIYAEVFLNNKQVVKLHKKFNFIETASNQPGVLKFKLLKERK